MVDMAVWQLALLVFIVSLLPVGVGLLLVHFFKAEHNRAHAHGNIVVSLCFIAMLVFLAFSKTQTLPGVMHTFDAPYAENSSGAIEQAPPVVRQKDKCAKHDAIGRIICRNT